jgi:tetrahydromethanopterin S-methyltransferase subunit B
VIDIKCENEEIGSIVSDEEQNHNCKMCVEEVQAIMNERDQLESDALYYNTTNGYTPQTASDHIVKALKGTSSANYHDGVCRYVCNQCVIEDVNQEMNMTMTTDCSVTTEVFSEAFVIGMRKEAARQVAKHKNELTLAGYDLSRNENIDSISYHISNSIQQMTRNELLSTLQLGAIAIQSMRILPESTSVVVGNVSQSLTVDMFGTLAAKQYSDKNVKDAINYELLRAGASYTMGLNSFIEDIERTYEEAGEILGSVFSNVIIMALGLLVGVIVIALFKIQKKYVKGSEVHGVPGKYTPLLET